MIKGIITTIQHMSIHDGPGIRSTVFLKGCNMRCQWCHNPETWSAAPQFQWLAHQCIGCHACMQACRKGARYVLDGKMVHESSLCTSCFACTEECYTNALLCIGESLSPDDVMQQVKEDMPYYQESDGGVTISGGEPLLQWEFCQELLKVCKEAGIHTAIETNASVSWERLEAVFPLTDMIMADVKLFDSKLHQKWTGIPNHRILENIQRLNQEKTHLIIRTPVIPGVNDNEQEISAIANFVASLEHVIAYELLPFHPLGSTKYTSLGMENPLECISSGVWLRMPRRLALL